MRTSKVVAAAVVAGLAAGAPAAVAQQPGTSPETPRQHLEEGTRQLLRAFELLLMAIPQYAPPEVLENGDIIIRRIRPGMAPDAPPAPTPVPDEPDGTRT